MGKDSSVSIRRGDGSCTLLILLGPPGAGKGTQCRRLAEVLDMPHISTGDILRDHVRRQTEWGQRLKAVIDSGALVPDTAVLAMLAERVAAQDCSTGFILDGFPRTREQAEALDDLFASLNPRGRLFVVRLGVSHRSLLGRLATRQICPTCQAVYGASVGSPRASGRCDADGASLIVRNDDRRETVMERLKIYDELISSIVDHYLQRHTVLEVNGENHVDDVTAEILKAIRCAGQTDPSYENARA